MKLDSDQLSVKIAEILDSLPDAYQVVLILYDEFGMSIEEVAEFLEESIPVIKFRIKNAEKLFRNEMAKYIEIEDNYYKRDGIKFGSDFELLPDPEVRELVRAGKKLNTDELDRKTYEGLKALGYDGPPLGRK